jgi:predicted nucleotidyltransferase
MVATLAVERPDLLAVILYGSVARRQERPLSEPDPSDVDILAVFESDDPHFLLKAGLEISRILGQADLRHLDAPREVQVMIASRGMREWDVTFVENVARDGLLLFARGELPEPLRGVRPLSFISYEAASEAPKP